MIQPYNTSCGEKNQSWNEKIEKDQDMAVYTLQIKENSTTKKMGVWGDIYERKKVRLMLIPCVVINRLKLCWRNVYHTDNYGYSEKHLLCK